MEGYSLTVFLFMVPREKKTMRMPIFLLGGGGGGGGRWANKVYCGICANGEFRLI